MIDNLAEPETHVTITLDRAAHVVPGRPLSKAQQRVLVALVSLCPLTGQDAEMAEVAELANMKPNAAKLALNALDDRGMAREEDNGHWWPTGSGRFRARELPGLTAAAA